MNEPQFVDPAHYYGSLAWLPKEAKVQEIRRLKDEFLGEKRAQESQRPAA